MIFWIVITFGILALVALYTTERRKRYAREKRLKQIQRRLAEKEQEANQDETNNENKAE